MKSWRFVQFIRAGIEGLKSYICTRQIHSYQAVGLQSPTYLNYYKNLIKMQSLDILTLFSLFINTG
jgi:hypothetical protein